MGPVGDCVFRMPTIACVVDSGMRFFRQMGVFLMSTMKWKVRRWAHLSATAQTIFSKGQHLGQ